MKNTPFSNLTHYSKGLSDKPLVTVWNKIDKIENRKEFFKFEAEKRSQTVAISSVTGEGLDNLMKKIETAVSNQMHYLNCTIPYAKSNEIVDALHRLSVLDELTYHNDHIVVRGYVPAFLRDRVLQFRETGPELDEADYDRASSRFEDWEESGYRLDMKELSLQLESIYFADQDSPGSTDSVDDDEDDVAVVDVDDLHYYLDDTMDDEYLPLREDVNSIQSAAGDSNINNRKEKKTIFRSPSRMPEPPSGATVNGTDNIIVYSRTRVDQENWQALAKGRHNRKVGSVSRKERRISIDVDGRFPPMQG